jgi:hypothetical protein
MYVNAISPVSSGTPSGDFSGALTVCALNRAQNAVSNFNYLTYLGATFYDHALSDAELEALSADAFDSNEFNGIIRSPIRSPIRSVFSAA